MRGRFIAVCALALMAAVPATADALSQKDQYLKLYPQAVKVAGKDQVGRNIVKYGMPAPGKDRHATKAEIERSIGVMNRWVHPPKLAPVAQVAQQQAPTPQSAPANTGGNGNLNHIAQCESGGNPQAVDPTGTYRGKYQFDQQTWNSVGGTGDPAAAPEAVQDQMAAKLYAQAGAGRWPVCGQ